MKRYFVLLSVALLLLASADAIALEKTAYPQRTINYIMGFPPGGKSDIQARGLLPYVEKYLGVSLTIQYLPGAGGRLGYNKIFKAKPDGYTIGHVAVPGSILGEFIAKPDYRTREFTPIFNCFVTPQVLVVAGDSYKNVEELVKAAKTKPLTNASSGRGTSSYLAAIVVANSLGLNDVRHVHFEGTPQALAALAGKHVDFSVCPTAVAIALSQAGKLKPLLTIADERDPAFPNVPTPKELGYSMTAMPGIDGIGGPPKLPPEKVKILEAAFIKAAQNPEFLKWAARANMGVTVMDHLKFSHVIDEQIMEAEKYKDMLLTK
jgi:tripartite-type tricarboxylate transporter receptor subunit TctC